MTTIRQIPENLVREFDRLVQDSRTALIGTHLNPDGDALGSALAVAFYLESRGLECELVCHHAAPENLRFLPGSERFSTEVSRGSFDFGVILDLDSTDRLGSVANHFEACSRVVVIDHHKPHHEPGDLRIIDESAPATAVILTRLMTQLGAQLNADIAVSLLTGIVTDTGSFRFRNTTPEALAMAALLIESGADINLVSEEVYNRKSLSSLRLLGRILENMRLESGGRIAWATVSFDDFEQNGASDEDTEGFVNELLAVRTVQIAALFREPRRGRVRVSLRSRGDFDVAAVAQEFGGGGHRNAAGISFERDLSQGAADVVERLKSCWESS